MIIKNGVQVRREGSKVFICIVGDAGQEIERELPITDWSAVVTDTLASALDGPLGRGLMDALLGIAS